MSDAMQKILEAGERFDRAEREREAVRAKAAMIPSNKAAGKWVEPIGKKKRKNKEEDHELD